MLHPRDIDLIRIAAHCDPFSALGPHDNGRGGWNVGVFLPPAETVTPAGRATGGMLRLKLTRRHDDGLFAGLGAGTRPTDHPRRVRRSGVAESVIDDPYRFGRVLGEMDVWLLADGSHLRPFESLGANSREISGVQGTAFAVRAPNASRVGVVGDFHGWESRRHPMRNKNMTPASAGISSRNHCTKACVGLCAT